MICQQHAGEGPGKAVAFQNASNIHMFVLFSLIFGFRFPAPQRSVIC